MDVIFEERVAKAMSHVQRVLLHERSGYILQANPNDSHCYGDKFRLVEWMTQGALRAVEGTLGELGLKEDDWKVACYWAKELGVAVTLRWRCEERCEWIRKETVEMEDPTRVETTGPMGRKVVDKVVTSITYHYWRWTGLFSLVLFSGSDPSGAQSITVTTRKAHCEVQTSSASIPYPLVLLRDPIDLDLTFLLLHGGRDFVIDRNDSDCHTPCRNTQVADALAALARVALWSQEVGAYLKGVVFQVQQTVASPEVSLALESISSESVFVPVLPLLDSRKDERRVLSQQDLDALLDESFATLRAKLGDMRKTFPSREGAMVVSAFEAELLCCLSHLQNLVEYHHDGIFLVERILRLQLIEAIGHEVSTDDLRQYLLYHNSNFFEERFASRAWAYAVQRSGCSCEGIVSIEPDYLFTTTSALHAPADIFVPISSSARVLCSKVIVRAISSLSSFFFFLLLLERNVDPVARSNISQRPLCGYMAMLTAISQMTLRGVDFVFAHVLANLAPSSC